MSRGRGATTGRRSGRCGEGRSIAESGEVGDDRNAGSPHRIATLAADTDQLEVAGVLHDLLGGKANGVGVESTGQTPIARDQDDQPLTFFAAHQQRVLVATQDGRQVGQDLVKQIRVRPRSEGGLLGSS